MQVTLQNSLTVAGGERPINGEQGALYFYDATTYWVTSSGLSNWLTSSGPPWTLGYRTYFKK